MSLEVRAFDAPLGAEIIGLDLNDPLGPETVETINQAFLIIMSWQSAIRIFPWTGSWM